MGVKRLRASAIGLAIAQTTLGLGLVALGVELMFELNHIFVGITVAGIGAYITYFTFQFWIIKPRQLKKGACE